MLAKIITMLKLYIISTAGEFLVISFNESIWPAAMPKRSAVRIIPYHPICRYDSPITERDIDIRLLSSGFITR